MTINPGAIPQFTGDVGAIETHAGELTAAGGQIGAAGAAVSSLWGGIAEFYLTPDTGTLVAASAPVASATASANSNLARVGAALSGYAAAVRPIAARLAQLKDEAGAFVGSISGDAGWNADQAKVDHNNALLHEVDVQVAALQAAERDAANQINTVSCALPWRVDGGGGGGGGGAGQVYGFDPGSIPATAARPWGTPAEYDAPWYADVWNNVWSFGEGVLGDGLWGGITGLVGMVNIFNWDTFSTSWKGIWAVGSGSLLDPETQNALKEIGKSLLAWDRWGQDPARALGSAVFNVATLPFVATKIAKVGEVGRIGELAGETGDATKTGDAGRTGGLAAETADAGRTGAAAKAGKVNDFTYRGPGNGADKRLDFADLIGDKPTFDTSSIIIGGGHWHSPPHADTPHEPIGHHQPGGEDWHQSTHINEPELPGTRGHLLRYGRPVDANGQPFPVFKGLPTREQALQGDLGNCGPIATIGAAAGHRPEAITWVFHTSPDGTILVEPPINPDGTYTLRLHETTTHLKDLIWEVEPTGRVITLRMTPDVPVFADNMDNAAFADQSTNGTAWTSIMEKAAAGVDQTWTPQRAEEAAADGLVQVGYDRLDTGASLVEQAELLTQITGEPSAVRRFYTAPGYEQVIEHELRSQLDQGKPVIVTTPLSQPGTHLAHQLVDDHSYEVVEVDNGLVYMRNPAGFNDPTPMSVRDLVHNMHRYYVTLQ